MARWRITSSGPGKLGAAAIPVPSKWAHGYQSARMVSGSPGTTRIPAPYPSAVPQGTLGYVGAGSHFSANAPEYWLPSVYYERGPLEHAPVSVESDNQMPVPAINPQGIAGTAVAVKPVFLGQTQVWQPKLTPYYPAARPRQG